MPEALAVDKDIVKGLVIQGVHPKEIESRLGVKAGTIYGWINRYAWKRPAITVSETTTHTGPHLSGSVEGISRKSRQRLAEELEEQIDRLRARNVPATVKGLSPRVQLASTLVSTAAKLFGWDNESSSSVVRVDLLSQCPNSVAEQQALNASLSNLPTSSSPANPALPAIMDSPALPDVPPKHA